jgi:hypothetical protein
MYSGVPLGGTHTVPQPRPVGCGIARSASPKSLIFADTVTDPSSSTEDTHSTCSSQARTTCVAKVRHIYVLCRKSPAPNALLYPYIAWLQVRVDVAPVMQKRHARRNTTCDGDAVTVGFE